MKEAAYTPPTGTGYPPYLNVKLDDQNVRVTVRGEPSTVPTADQSSLHTVEGQLAFIDIPRAEFHRICTEVFAS